MEKGTCRERDFNMKKNYPDDKGKVDCPRFKPIPGNEKYCALTDRCRHAGIEYIQEGFFYYDHLLSGRSRCTGIRRN